MLNYIFERYSLYKHNLCKNPQTFSSGERGPRGAVNEEDKVCTAKSTNLLYRFHAHMLCDCTRCFLPLTISPT